MRISYLEDDLDQAALITHWLDAAGHQCTHYATSAALLADVSDPPPDLILLDWYLSDTTGEQVLGSLHQRGAALPPVVFLSANDDAADILRILEAGAVDHIRKPVKRETLLKRIAAFAVPVNTSAKEPCADFLPYMFGPGTTTVRLHGRELKLDDSEFAIALHLFEHAGKLVTVSLLATLVEPSSDSSADIRAAKNAVSRVRAKLRLTPANGWKLQTVTGVGFRLLSMG